MGTRMLFGIFKRSIIYYVKVEHRVKMILRSYWNKTEYINFLIFQGLIFEIFYALKIFKYLRAYIRLMNRQIFAKFGKTYSYSHNSEKVNI